MQLILNVSGAEFGVELKELLDTLSPEEKKELAKQVFIKVLTETTDTHRTIQEKELNVFEDIRKNHLYGSDREKGMTDEQLRKHHKYPDLMARAKSVKEEAVSEIVKAGVLHFKDVAKALVENDEGLKKIWATTEHQLKENFPKFMHDAMMLYFVGGLRKVQHDAEQALNISQYSQEVLQRIDRQHNGH